MRIRRIVFAGLGVLAFLVAVILTQMSADESRWSNFGISVGLSIGLAVFMWFITDGLRADIKQVLGNQDELAKQVDELMKTIGQDSERIEDQDPLVGRVNKIVIMLGQIIAELGKLSGETLGILDGVLTALDVQLEDNGIRPGIRKQRPGNRWSIIPPSPPTKTAVASIKAAVEDGPSPSRMEGLKTNLQAVEKKQDILHGSLNTLLENVKNLEKTELNDSLGQLRKIIEELKTQLKDEEAMINDDSAGDQLQSKDQT